MSKHEVLSVGRVSWREWKVICSCHKAFSHRSRINAETMQKLHEYQRLIDEQPTPVSEDVKLGAYKKTLIDWARTVIDDNRIDLARATDALEDEDEPMSPAQYEAHVSMRGGAERTIHTMNRLLNVLNNT